MVRRRYKIVSHTAFAINHLLSCLFPMANTALKTRKSMMASECFHSIDCLAHYKRRYQRWSFLPEADYRRRTPTLMIAAVNGGEFGDAVTAVRICEPFCVTTKWTVSAGPPSAGLVGCGVKVNVPVQLGFTV
jgi:hypothetical protein